MNHASKQQPQQRTLYLEVCSINGEPHIPLHTSIVLFLLSFCDCESFAVVLVTTTPVSLSSLRTSVPKALDFPAIQLKNLPSLARSCRLPAVLDHTGRYCRAGLAVVLRHIINKSIEADPSRKDVTALLGFKKTCLKACAEVSQWTRLCELDIPRAVEKHLQNPDDHILQLPPAILQLEKILGEPVKVHNDDKIRRQKLQQQQSQKNNRAAPEAQESPDCQTEPARLPREGDDLELRAALEKLSVDAVPHATTRENSEIRKVKTSDLPLLEHVFAEGLYFTLTDVVLLPCIHQYLSSLQSKAAGALSRLPLLLRWYGRVREVPGVPRAAGDCGMVLIAPRAPETSPESSAGAGAAALERESPQETKQVPFVGGPRPTMTKLKENGIEAAFAPHPCPTWTLLWDDLPGAANPTEGKMSDVRALRKRQQLNNLIAMVTELAKPGQTVVDFCSGGGHVGIVLAHARPDCQVILIENKEESLVKAKGRSDELCLSNVGFIQANLDYFCGPFHIGVALHACGVATDMVMGHCIQAGAAFVISPCCYGFIQNTLKFSFPRSKRFQETLSYKEHMVLCRFADQTAGQLSPDRRLIGKQCMGLVDLDRSWAAEAHGYSVQVMTMEPESCSPKNNMLVGVVGGNTVTGSY